MDDPSTPLDNLRAARALLGLKQDELATRAGVSRQMIVRIEGGDLGVSMRTITKVRTALKVAGIDFVPETEARNEGIARRK